MAAKYYISETDQTIILLTPIELTTVPDGTVLLDIFGKEHTKGKDYIDDDTRGGHLAFGFLESQGDTRKKSIDYDELRSRLGG